MDCWVYGRNIEITQGLIILILLYKNNRFENSFIVQDDIEIGFNNFIPLWLLGFLY